VAGGLLVVGLGNPGPGYQNNRHNFGFMVVDELVRKALFSAPWQGKFFGHYTKIAIDHLSYTVLKPMTFMNLSGKSVARAVQFLGFELHDTVVVHDEVDLAFNAIRIKEGGGTAGHKGLASIENMLGDGGFIRVRMGVGRPAEGSVSDYVLADFNPEERSLLGDIIGQGVAAIQMVAKEGVAAAMNAFNRRR
jgi:PTH1 family peptidyl-tRNA hydrolase